MSIRIPRQTFLTKRIVHDLDVNAEVILTDDAVGILRGRQRQVVMSAPWMALSISTTIGPRALNAEVSTPGSPPYQITGHPTTIEKDGGIVARSCRSLFDCLEQRSLEPLGGNVHMGM